MNSLSIIVSLYNKESYIEECLKSLINQNTNYRYEIIVVDDGSTDNSLNQIRSFVESKQIKLIKQKNGGQGSARNAGIAIARAKFVTFVDADDVVYPNFVENICFAASDAEDFGIIRYKFNYLDDITGKTQPVRWPLSLYFKISYGMTYAVNLDKFPDFKFVTGVKIEDMITFLQYFKNKTIKQKLIKKPIFKYRVNIKGGQDSTTITKKYIEDFGEAIDAYKLFENKNILHKLDFFRKKRIYLKMLKGRKHD